MLVENVNWKTIMETLWKFLKKLKTEHTMQQLHYYLEKMNSVCPYGIFIPMLIVVFILHNSQEKEKKKYLCLLTTEKITNMWFIYTIEYYSGIKITKFSHL